MSMTSDQAAEVEKLEEETRAKVWLLFPNRTANTSAPPARWWNPKTTDVVLFPSLSYFVYRNTTVESIYLVPWSSGGISVATADF